MKQFKLQILTQEQPISEEQVDSVTIPTYDGQITVLADHISLFSRLKPGQLIIHQGDKSHMFAVIGGFVDVSPTRVKILADTAIRVEEINELKAEQAKQEAQRALQETETDQHFLEAQLQLQRSLLELDTIRKWKKLRQ